MIVMIVDNFEMRETRMQSSVEKNPCRDDCSGPQLKYDWVPSNIFLISWASAIGQHLCFGTPFPMSSFAQDATQPAANESIFHAGL
jgi:hypothetical protein